MGPSGIAGTGCERGYGDGVGYGGAETAAF